MPVDVFRHVTDSSFQGGVATPRLAEVDINFPQKLHTVFLAKLDERQCINSTVVRRAFRNGFVICLSYEVRCNYVKRVPMRPQFLFGSEGPQPCADSSSPPRVTRPPLRGCQIRCRLLDEVVEGGRSRVACGDADAKRRRPLAEVDPV